MKWTKKAIFSHFAHFGCTNFGGQKSLLEQAKSKFLYRSSRLGLKLLFEAIKTVVER